MEQVWSKEAIIVRSSCGNPSPKQVPALCWSHWAIHHSLGVENERSWTLTHTPTGFAVTQWVTGRILKRLAAILAELPIRWENPEIQTCMPGEVWALIFNFIYPTGWAQPISADAWTLESVAKLRRAIYTIGQGEHTDDA